MAKAKEKPKPKASKIEPEKAAGKATPKNRTPKPKEKDLPAVEGQKCSFCGHLPITTNLMIAGPPPNNCFICENCVEVCLAILLDEDSTEWTRRLLRLMQSVPKKSKVIPLENKKKGKGN